MSQEHPAPQPSGLSVLRPAGSEASRGEPASVESSHARGYLLKRPLDFVGGLMGLALALPVLLITTLALRLWSPGSVIYGSTRWGRGGRRFTMWKFRTMQHGAEESLEEDPLLSRSFEQNVKLPDDPRITGVGRFLRRYSLDELPQLWNVVRGEMSLVGPRPKLVGEATRYGEALSTVLSMRPGLTGLWQVSGRNSTTYERRIELDLAYARGASLSGDLVILLKTIPAVLSGDGAY